MPCFKPALKPVHLSGLCERHSLYASKIKQKPTNLRLVCKSKMTSKWPKSIPYFWLKRQKIYFFGPQVPVWLIKGNPLPSPGSISLYIRHILYYEYYIINLPLPLKQSFRIRDYCLIIKSRTYLKIPPTSFFFSLRTPSENCFISPSKLVGWAQNWCPSWRGQISFATSLVVLHSFFFSDNIFLRNVETKISEILRKISTSFPGVFP